MTQAALYALRVSAAPAQGLGHLRRMQALAMHLHHVIWVSDDAGLAVLSQKGCGPVMLGDTQGAWADHVPNVACVVTDIHHHHNQTQARQEITALVQRGLRVCVIDSMPPDHFVPDPAVPLPQIVVRPYLAPKVGPAPGNLWLTGPKYSILSPQIAKAREVLSPDSAPPGILVTCGGSDPNGLSLDIMTALGGVETPITVIAGPFFAASVLDQLHDLIDKHPHARLVQAPDSLLPYIVQSTVVIGRPGLIRYEAAALGRHGLYLWDGPEYQDYFDQFNASGVAELFHINAPNARQAFLEKVSQIGSRAASGELNCHALRCIDGQGAARVARAIWGDMGHD
jgi:UDP-2,4-diacetamido-2,4,6-trideoxy-beta-L-altropyranose hydrolase